MNTYTHVDMADKADAVGQLPVPAMPSAETPLALELARIAAVPWHEVASAGDDAVQLSAERTGNKNIEFPGSVSIVRRDAQSDLSSGRGTRKPCKNTEENARDGRRRRRIRRTFCKSDAFRPQPGSHHRRLADAPRGGPPEDREGGRNGRREGGDLVPQNCPGYSDQMQVLLRCQNRVLMRRDTTPYFALPIHTHGTRFGPILTRHRILHGAARRARESVKNREGQDFMHVLRDIRDSVAPPTTSIMRIAGESLYCAYSAPHIYKPSLDGSIHWPRKRTHSTSVYTAV